MSDTEFLIALAMAEVVTSIVFARWISGRCPQWSVTRVMGFGATPLPAALGGLCLVAALDAVWTMTRSPETCGVDGCGMAFAFSLAALFGCAGIYVLGAAATRL